MVHKWYILSESYGGVLEKARSRIVVASSCMFTGEHIRVIILCWFSFCLHFDVDQNKLWTSDVVCVFLFCARCLSQENAHLIVTIIIFV